MNELALFAGAGGSILGGKLNGWTTVCAVEYDAFRIAVLLTRQNDGCLTPFPVWDDVRTFDGVPWRGTIDVVSAGFPCQDIATGSSTATGIAGERSGLWKEAKRIIGEVRPGFVLLENSPLITSRGLGVVLGDLAELGFDAEWGMLSAANAGANHLRKRWWLVASNPNQIRKEGRNAQRPVERCDEDNISPLLAPGPFPKSKDDIPEPWVFRGGDGIPFGLAGVAAAGDAQVPAVVRLAWETLKP